MIGEGHEAQYVDEAVQGALSPTRTMTMLIAGKKAFLNQPFFWLRITRCTSRVFVLFGRTLVPSVRACRWTRRPGIRLVQRHAA
jgi:hypothetical protein